MKYKKPLIISTVLIAVFMFLLYAFRTSDSLLGHISSKLINGNSISLHFRNISPNSIKISSVSEDSRTIIFENGLQINSIEKDVYGPFYFEIKLSKDLKFDAGHWKTVCWGAHDYSISLIKNKNGYNLTFEADGPNYTKIDCSYDLLGKLHGQYLSYYENGNLGEKSNYNHGKIDGRRTFYYENGQTRVSEIWKNGILK